MQEKVDALYKAYEDTAKLVKERSQWQKEFDIIAKQFEEKRKNADATIMIYGVYNAGKSTLINAMRGSADAKMGDFPLTDKVTGYEWGKYEILDCPGVDAPIKHENVTKEQLAKSDVVIFVLNPVGVADERKTLEIMSKLILEGKKVFAVLNPKDSNFNDDAFFKLRYQIRGLLQEIVGDNYSRKVIDFPIRVVYAKRALDGRLKNKPVLVEKSGIEDFERELKSFLSNNQVKDIYLRLSFVLKQFLEKFIDSEQVNSSSKLVEVYNDLLKTFLSNKQQCLSTVERSIESEGNALGTQVRSTLLRNHKIEQSQLEDMYRNCLGNVENLLKSQIEYIRGNIMVRVDKYNACLNEQISLQDKNGDIHAVECTPEQSFDASSFMEESSSGKTVDTIASLAQIAVPFFIRSIPIGALIIGGIQILKSIFGGDSGNDEQYNQMRAQVAADQARERERQRFEQEVFDNADLVKEDFKNTARKAIQPTFAELDHIQSVIENDCSVTSNKELNDKRILSAAIAAKEKIPSFN